MRAILVLVLTAVLLYLYHKVFTVVYVNALAGIIREIAVCFVLALVILSIVFNALGIETSSKDTKTDQPPTQGQTNSSLEQPGSTRNSFLEQGLSQEPPVKGFYGRFYNTALLNNGAFDSFIIIGDSKWSPNSINIFGVATAPGLNFVQNLDIDIPMPEGNIFTFQADELMSTLTITLHPENYTLEITQEPMNPEIEAAYTGSYVDGDTWKSLEKEYSAALERNQVTAGLPTDPYLPSQPAMNRTEPFPPTLPPIDPNDPNACLLSDYLGLYVNENGCCLRMEVASQNGRYFGAIYSSRSDAQNGIKPLVEFAMGEMAFQSIFTFEDAAGNLLYLERDSSITDYYTLFLYGDPYFNGIDMSPYLNTMFYMVEQYIDVMT